MRPRTRPMPKSYIIEMPNKDKSDSESSEEDSKCEECDSKTIRHRRLCEKCLQIARKNKRQKKEV